MCPASHSKRCVTSEAATSRDARLLLLLLLIAWERLPLATAVAVSGWAIAAAPPIVNKALKKSTIRYKLDITKRKEFKRKEKSQSKTI